MSKVMTGEFYYKFGLTIVESDASRAELLEFVDTLRHELENKFLHKA